MDHASSSQDLPPIAFLQSIPSSPVVERNNAAYIVVHFIAVCIGATIDVHDESTKGVGRGDPLRSDKFRDQFEIFVYAIAVPLHLKGSTTGDHR